MQSILNGTVDIGSRSYGWDVFQRDGDDRGNLVRWACWEQDDNGNPISHVGHGSKRGSAFSEPGKPPVEVEAARRCLAMLRTTLVDLGMRDGQGWLNRQIEALGTTGWQKREG